MSRWSKEEFKEMLANSETTILDSQSLRPVVVKGQQRIEQVEGPKWTKTEIRFAQEYLEPGVEAGHYIFWTDQVTIRLPGQKYTPDFLAMNQDGQLLFFEVKGKFKLGSSARSSVKLRWFRSQIPFDNVRVFRATETEPGTFKLKEIKLKRMIHPILKEKI